MNKILNNELDLVSYYVIKYFDLCQIESKRTYAMDSLAEFIKISTITKTYGFQLIDILIG